MQKFKQRLLPVLVATLTVLSAMAVVAVSQPASAAEGSFEVLTDHDDDPATPATRQFAGETRYDTAIRAAGQYFRTHGWLVDSLEEKISIQALIIASGESLIDAAVAAGLAGQVRAPVILTPSDQLHELIPDFINQWQIASVIVLGGPAAVSESVVDELRAIPSIADNVKRYAGTSRFDTAAKVAIENFSDNYTSYCNSYGKTAVLVAGDAESFADVIVAGPFAYAERFPVLLVSTNGLPAETTNALDTLDIRHVVIIGGQYSFGDTDKLENDLLASGRSNVTRLEGENPFATSVRVREEMQKCLGTEFSEETVALISDTALADGISAAPLLGEGFSRYPDLETTSALLVSSQELPSETRKHLETTPVPLAITVIGGENAISTAVAQAAVEASNTFPPQVVVSGLPRQNHVFKFGETARTTELEVEPADAVISVTTSEDLFTVEVTGTGTSRTLSVTPPASDEGSEGYYSENVTFTVTSAGRTTLTRTVQFSVADSDCISEGLGSPGFGSPGHATVGLLSPNLAASFSSIFKSC